MALLALFSFGFSAPIHRHPVCRGSLQRASSADGVLTCSHRCGYTQVAMRLRNRCPLCDQEIVDDPLSGEILDPLEVIERILQSHTGVSLEQMRRRDSSRHVSAARDAAIYLARVIGYGHAEIAAWLHRHSNSVRRAWARLKQITSGKEPARVPGQAERLVKLRKKMESFMGTI